MIAYYENRHLSLSRWRGHRLQSPAHLHPHLELVVFLKGNSVGYAEAERYEICAGDVFLTFPSQVHRYESRSEEDYYILIADPELLPELSSYFNEGQPASALLKGAGEDEEIGQLIKWLVEQPEPKTPLEESVQHGYLLALFSRVIGKMELTAVSSGGSHAFRTVVDYCTKNYAKELSLSVLESELHISKYYISHLFSERLKIGFNDYINSLRIAQACRYLRRTERSVTEISTLVGFSTLRTFNRAFSKQIGCTPSEYRKKTEWKEKT